MRVYTRKPPAERFWNKVDKSGGLDACWPWTGARHPAGYGLFSVTRGVWPTGSHRYAWELANGSIPEGRWVLHRCDNPPCCNPSHLFLGDCQDNETDKVSKGRQARGDRHGRRKHPEAYPSGERHHAAKLTDAQVAEVRRLAGEGHSQRALARRFGMSQPGIGKLLRGEHRKELQ